MSETGNWDPSRTALLTIDLQNDFLHPEGAYGRAGQTSQNMSALPDRIAPIVEALRD
ncbi:MAG: cysteine hydrolase, partial [Pseudomonadota bacterium]